MSTNNGNSNNGNGHVTPRQQRFVDEYLVDLNATQAATRAGYSPKTANEQGARLLANVSIRAEVAERQAALAKATGITQEWVLTQLQTNVERALQAVQVLDSRGQPTGEYRYEGNVANGALKLIGQHIGMFSGESDPDMPAVKTLSDADLEKKRRALKLA